MPSLDEPLDTGSARDDMLACLRAVATPLNGLLGEAIRGLMAETLRNPDLMDVIRMRFIDRNVSHFLDVLRRVAARDEVRATALTPQ